MKIQVEEFLQTYKNLLILQNNIDTDIDTYGIRGVSNYYFKSCLSDCNHYISIMTLVQLLQFVASSVFCSYLGQPTQDYQYLGPLIFQHNFHFYIISFFSQLFVFFFSLIFGTIFVLYPHHQLFFVNHKKHFTKGFTDYTSPNLIKAPKNPY